jgi:hypothetical protein
MFYRFHRATGGSRPNTSRHRRETRMLSALTDCASMRPGRRAAARVSASRSRAPIGRRLHRTSADAPSARLIEGGVGERDVSSSIVAPASSRRRQRAKFVGLGLQNAPGY